MVVDPGVRHRRRRNRLACRARRTTVRAGRLLGTPYVEEAAFAGARAVAIGGTAGTGTARVLVHPKTGRNRQAPNIFCDSFALDGAFLTHGRAEIVGVGYVKSGEDQ